eukprot:TRINITY_DN46279_c0_g1_i1.p1 TRINITY_DN46279_c0_g1~~TRINITY_DN46279_c0_g1_i1.p1  ORF type:complete len:183 (+),score=23.25 TRINITY_DN46279_c0_g1_i1:124-672(+)
MAFSNYQAMTLQVQRDFQAAQREMAAKYLPEQLRHASATESAAEMLASSRSSSRGGGDFRPCTTSGMYATTGSFRADARPLALLETLPLHQPEVLDHYLTTMSRRTMTRPQSTGSLKASQGDLFAEGLGRSPLHSSLTSWHLSKSLGNGQLMLGRPAVALGTMKPAGHILNITRSDHARGRM